MDYNELFSNVMRIGFYLCQSGTCEITVNDKTFRIKPGDGFLRSPLLVVSSFTASEDFILETIVEEKIEVFVPVANANFEIISNVLANQVYHLSLTAEEQEELLGIKHKIDAHKTLCEELPSDSKRRQLLQGINQMLEQMAILKYADIYLSRHEGETLEAHKEQNVMVRFVFLLFKNYKQHREVGYYAGELNLSSGYFTTLIRKISQRTPSEWIAIVTVNQAKRLLRMGGKSIKEVASELGFPEQFTFHKYFKKHTGLSPKEYAAKRK